MTKSLSNITGVDECKHFSIFRRLFAEFIGTFLLTALLLSGMLQIESVIGFAVAAGLLLASVVALTGHVSGGHVNPAVTLGMLICCFIKLLPAILYVAVQILGALLGQMVAKWIYESTRQDNNIINNNIINSNDNDDNMNKNKNNIINVRKETNMSGLAIFGIEMLETFLIVSVAVSVSDPRRHLSGLGSSLAIGLSVSAALCAAPQHRGRLNPAVALASAVSSRSFTNHWAFWLGPLLAGLLAGFIYKYIMTSNQHRPGRTSIKLKILRN